MFTKLKVNSNNSNLPSYGAIVFNLKRVLTQDFFYPGVALNSAKMNFRILGDNNIVFSNDQKSYYGESGLYYIKGGNIGEYFQLSVDSKYDFYTLTCGCNGGVNVNTVEPVFNPESIKNLTSISEIGEDLAGIVLDINDYLTASNQLIWRIHSGGSCDITGNAETYLSTAWHQGRRTGFCNFERNRCSWPGLNSILQYYQGDIYYHYATFSDSGISVEFKYDEGNNPVLLATGTYNGTSWSYIHA